MFRSLIQLPLKNSLRPLCKSLLHPELKFNFISASGFHKSKRLMADAQKPSGDPRIGYYYVNAVNPETSIPPKDGQPRKKLETGLVGLDVVENWREVLIDLYNQILRDIQIIPPEATFRKNMEALVKFRLGVVQSTDDYEVVEKTIQYGEVEQLILDARADLKLIPYVAEVKMWEVDPDVKSTPVLYLEILREYERSLQSSPGGKSLH